MTIGVAFTEEEKEVLEELNEIYDKITNGDIFDCDSCSCPNCPFCNEYSDCAKDALRGALIAIIEG